LSKLEQYGITGALLKWLYAFLHGRTQLVLIENCFSSFTDVAIGVSQGSVLGPLLFLMFINDIVSSCCGNTSAKLFADDVKLYNIYNCEDGMLNPQQSVDKLIYWSNIWQLKVNVDKCHVLSIRNRNKSKDSSPNQNLYLLDGVPLAMFFHL
jgi:ribonucleases P/MRP protein subunit RPP40